MPDDRQLGGDGLLNLPFLAQEPVLNPPEDFALSMGLTVLAARVPLPQGGDAPALVFRFMGPTGQLYDPMLLLLERDEMAQVGQLVTAAADAALNGRIPRG